MRPSAFAVLRLISNSYFVGASPADRLAFDPSTILVTSVSSAKRTIFDPGASCPGGVARSLGQVRVRMRIMKLS